MHALRLARYSEIGLVDVNSSLRALKGREQKTHSSDTLPGNATIDVEYIENQQLECSKCH